MPTTVIPGKRMDLVHDYRFNPIEESSMVHTAGYQHGLDRLWGGQETIRRPLQGLPTACLIDITVPHLARPAEETQVGLKAGVQVVEKRLERANIQDAGARPLLRKHPRNQGEDGRLRLAAGGGSQKEAMRTPQDRLDAQLL
jgi:hypothetical protein